jgi:hypothetical protein
MRKDVPDVALNVLKLMLHEIRAALSCIPTLVTTSLTTWS